MCTLARVSETGTGPPCPTLRPSTLSGNKHLWGPALRQANEATLSFLHTKWGTAPNQGGGAPACPLPACWSPALRVNPGLLPWAQVALAQDPAAKAPSDSSVISVLLSTMQSHPEAQQLLVTVYSLLTIICSQGGSARPPSAEAGCQGHAQCWALA